MPSITIEIEGDYDQSQINQAMIILGELIINKVKEHIRDMNLIISGALLQGWFSNWDGRTLTIENTQEYAQWIEYGTYGYYEIYGTEEFPENMDPKKKNMITSLKKQFPSGMQPFAPVRRVIYNANVLGELVRIAFNNII